MATTNIGNDVKTNCSSSKIRGIARQVFVYIATYCTNVCIISFHSQVKVLKSVPNQIQYKNMTTFKVLFVFFRHTANIGYIFR